MTILCAAVDITLTHGVLMSYHARVRSLCIGNGSTTERAKTCTCGYDHKRLFRDIYVKRTANLICLYTAGTSLATATVGCSS